MIRMLTLARLFFLLLGMFTLARWLMGPAGVHYDKGHHVFSLVNLTLMSAFFYGAFCRRWLDFGVMQAVGLGLLLGLAAQIVILLATLVSYALGLQTYFNHPRALNATAALPVAQALLVRLGGAVTNTIAAGIVGALGWAAGALLIEKP